MTKEHTAECMNILGEFCGIRDVPELTPEALKRRFGIRQADVMVFVWRQYFVRRRCAGGCNESACC